MRYFAVTCRNIDCVTLLDGEIYDWTTLELVGWCNASWMLTDDCVGYFVGDYFRDGKYLGPDEFGIFPVFARPSLLALVK